MRSRGPRCAITAWLGVMLVGLLGCTDPEAAAYVEVVDGRLTVTRPVAWEIPIEVDQPWTSGFRPAPDSLEFAAAIAIAAILVVAVAGIARHLTTIGHDYWDSVN